MKEIIILVLSVSLVSVFASTANAMRSFLQPSEQADDAQETIIDNSDECALSPIVYDQPPDDEENWPGCRD
ncbi:hypothetical protein [Acaryochloris sp. IP29b_bin.137]|uniref:hypothetical protein n=1 Tax=Acaryochloris sp. IP29b_bin.137 TaxID=2969217 RepID=UPI002607008B|nr:hypothetical protein [Acaryochloris sp. IP29b_bin.137]